MSVRRNGLADAIAEVEALLQDAPDIIGTEALRVIDEHFEREELIGVQSWPPRVPGTPRDDRKLLSDTNTLQDSIDYQVRRGGTEVVIGVDLARVPYAQIHNEGGTIPRTQAMTAFFWAQYLRTGEDFFKALALGKGDIKVPARPYLFITQYMVDRITKAIDAALAQARKQSTRQ